MNTLRFTLFSIVLITMMGCFFSPSLPKSRPADVTIVLHEDGGMLPNSRIITLAETKSTVFTRAGTGEETTETINITTEQLDALYAVLRDNDFDSISTYTNETHDRGGTSVWVSWGDTSIRVHSNGDSYINKRYTERYTAIVRAIQDLVK